MLTSHSASLSYLDGINLTFFTNELVDFFNDNRLLGELETERAIFDINPVPTQTFNQCDRISDKRK
jgi:hypothetical protein